jgi:hypothetical protein
MKPNNKRFAWFAAKGLGAGIAVGTASYATYAGVTWLTYGHPCKGRGKAADPLLDMFMPKYDVADRHRTYVATPADVALKTACEMDLLGRSLLVRGIIRTREMILGGEPDKTVMPSALLEQMKSLGWGVLAELPGREIVVGGVTKPWEAHPVFRALPPDEFASFMDPGYVKIIWTLRTDAIGKDQCIFRTETRALAPDRESRRKFRKYWSFLSPGIKVIRRVMLPGLKAEAEARWKEKAA